MSKFLCFLALLVLVAASSSNAEDIHQSYNKNIVRIVNGEEAEDAFAPYQISMQSDYRGHFCGGAIIGRRYILTAAHCVYQEIPDNIYIITGTNEWRKPGKKYSVDNWVIHAKYNHKEYHDDLAVIRLTESIQWNKRTKPVKLPRKRYPKPGQTAIVTGWGSLHLGERSPLDLQKVYLKYITYDECYDKLKDLQYLLSEGNVCTYTEDDKGPCKGDSGGPLVTKDNYLIGVISWGKPCAKGYPDVYASPLYYKDWIKNAIKKLEKYSSD